MKSDLDAEKSLLHSVASKNAKKQSTSSFFAIKSPITVFLIIFMLLGVVNLGRFVDVDQREQEWQRLTKPEPLVIAHRGSSGMRPEHTVASYELAVKQGADIIECDVGVTKDLQLVCSHDVGINKTTDVHKHVEFSDRIRTYEVNGRSYTDYFIFDFTLEELLTLRKVEYRDYRNQRYNGAFTFATFDDYVRVAQGDAGSRKLVGIYPETKNPEVYNRVLAQRGANTSMEDLLLAALTKHGYVDRNSACFLQSFSIESLQYMSERSKLRLVWLREAKMSEAEILQAEQAGCYAIGADKDLIIRVDPSSREIDGVTSFVDHLHSLGIKVHVFTFRNEGRFLAWNYGADPYAEYEQFYRAGVDAFFTDFPATAVNYLATTMSKQQDYVQRFASYLCSSAE